jgi:hypothetical protein
MKRFLAAMVASMALAGSAVGAVAAAGAAEAALPACGRWAPSVGEFGTEYDSATKTYVARVSFVMSAADKAAFSCTGSTTLELDVSDYSEGLNNGVRTHTSNMPGDYLDTELFDNVTSRGARVLTVGTSRARDLQPNVRYTTVITVRDVKIKGKTLTDSKLNFQRGHWAQGNGKDGLWCKAHGNTPQQCIFRDGDDHFMKPEGVYSQVPLDRGYRTADFRSWGTDRRSVLPAGGRLNPGMRITSPNGVNDLVMQSDGNLVEYAGDRALWATGTREPGTVALVQSDGNFVLIAPGNRSIWSAGTYRWPGTVIEIQNDKNVVGYAPGHVAVWANWGNRR